MQTITLKPGEELRVICAPAGNNNTGTLVANSNSEANEYNSVGGKKSRKTRKVARAQDGGKKRKANPFMKFAGEERKNIMKSNPGMAVTDVGRELGKRWRALSDAEKAKY